ncbi:hypothetical protein GTS_22790 [Gandjariella thermophila]|uniref:Uncharacterized protein n=1 Tax=Gandjariella thermophila TaxID=1931992 RepID=A0A4D4J802_9PSEU|nr:hypothetical protein GTS_22790 [Gandjariella thermophila]
MVAANLRNSAPTSRANRGRRSAMASHGGCGPRPGIPPEIGIPGCGALGGGCIGGCMAGGGQLGCGM